MHTYLLILKAPMYLRHLETGGRQTKGRHRNRTETPMPSRQRRSQPLHTSERTSNLSRNSSMACLSPDKYLGSAVLVILYKLLGLYVEKTRRAVCDSTMTGKVAVRGYEHRRARPTAATTPPKPPLSGRMGFLLVVRNYRPVLYKSYRLAYNPKRNVLAPAFQLLSRSNYLAWSKLG